MFPRRTIKELITIYETEPELKDIYVEGITDKLVLERFLKKNEIHNVSIKEINDIDFLEFFEENEEDEENEEIKQNNKKKLIALNDIINAKCTVSLDGISIIIDLDYDAITDNINKGKYILYTDYNSIESYLFNSSTIDNFYTTILRGFRISSHDTIKIIKPVLEEKFLIRLVLHQEVKPKRKHVTNLKKSVKISKTSGEIIFCPINHLDKILANIRKTSEQQFFLDLIRDYRLKLDTDYRKNVRGHDFIEFLFIYIDAIQNNIGLSAKMLERSLFQCIDYSELKKEKLFSTVFNKYKI